MLLKPSIPLILTVAPLQTNPPEILPVGVNTSQEYVLPQPHTGPGCVAVVMITLYTCHFFLPALLDISHFLPLDHTVLSKARAGGTSRCVPPPQLIRDTGLRLLAALNWLAMRVALPSTNVLPGVCQLTRTANSPRQNRGSRLTS
jgi:hypothetical protein